ncbi:hypothetical protein, partial [Pseudomonas lini]|uniref:hypothetical protein n=1 Tax=Pseudomonas lini TaxID=163011 RepID=UPI0027D8274D
LLVNLRKISIWQRALGGAGLLATILATVMPPTLEPPLPQLLSSAVKPNSAEPRKMAVILKQNGSHWPPFSASAAI